jgi:hypothetical protein
MTLAAAWLILAVVPAAGIAQDEEKDGPDVFFPRAVDHNQYPDMAVKGGTLVRDLKGGWTLGTIPLVFTENSRIGGPDQGPGVLEDGRQAYAMGALRGGMLFVHYLTIVSQEKSLQRGTVDQRTVPGMPTIAEDSLPQ